MRVLSYNILDGGGERLNLLRQVIEAENPDVVGLIEADEPDVVEILANNLRMDFIYAPGNKKASALLSRFPIIYSINHAPQHPALTKSLLEAGILDSHGVEWTLGVLHLHAHATEANEDIRHGEITEVLEIFRRHRETKRPHLLLGDFNSISPDQQIEPSLCKTSTQREFYDNGGYLPRRVISTLLQAGYCDSLAALHPRASQTAGSFSTEHPGQRVDYIFTHGIESARLKEGRVIYDEPSRQASDHFPIFLDLR